MLLTLAFLGAPAPAPPAAAVETFEYPTYIPAGVSDAAGTVGGVRTPDGGAEGIDLATGRSIWRSAAPSRVLWVARGRAFVLEERAGRPLRVAAYDARSGRRVRAYDLAKLALPGWASLGNPAGGRQWTEFAVAARHIGGILEVRYDATRMQAYGFRPAGPVDRIQGLARIGLETGRVELRPVAGSFGPPITEPAPPMPGVRLLAIHARASDAALMRGGPPPNLEGALIAGARRFGFELSPDTRAVTVHRWSAPRGRREPPLRLEHGHPTDAVWATIDRRHVLLRRAHEQQRYDLYSLETGAPIGMLERPVDAAVVGPRVYWTTAGAEGRLHLVATETGSGRERWRRLVRGPDPPPGPPIP